MHLVQQLNLLEQLYKRTAERTGKNIDAAKWEKMDCGNQKSIYELFIHAILNDKQENPNFRRGSEIQKLLEICEKSHCEGKILNV